MSAPRPSAAQWIRYVIGQALIQISCGVVAAGSFAFATFFEQGPNDPPRPLVAGILLIGCFPIIAVGVMRGQRTLRDRMKSGDVSARGFWLTFLLPLAALAGVIALAAG
jgi:hypothetical protein